MAEDRIQFSPKLQFQKRIGDPTHYRELMASNTIQEASRDVLAEMAWRGFTNEQMRGACAFLEMLLNFSEPEKKAAALPVKPLST